MQSPTFPKEAKQQTKAVLEMEGYGGTKVIGGTTESWTVWIYSK